MRVKDVAAILYFGCIPGLFCMAETRAMFTNRLDTTVGFMYALAVIMLFTAQVWFSQGRKG